ncbi:MAG: ArsR family transcriptional regulator [Methanomicrobiales archaeon]|jgi:ArsR family transcriptional regulator|nr:ArsR family transcriptional regulator [Methanomicrobiales archaeon]
MRSDDSSLSQLLGILGNENRRRIISLLETRSCFVTEISERLSLSPKVVIEHLTILERAEIITHQTGQNRRKYYHLSHDLEISIQKIPKEQRIVPADPSPEHQYRDGLNQLHQLFSVREYLSAEIEKVDTQIDTQLDQVLSAGLRADISRDEIMVSAALAHGVQTIDEIMSLYSLSHEEVLRVLLTLVEQGFVTQDEQRYALRDSTRM